MGIRQQPLSKDEITRAFDGPAGEQYPVILTPAQLARLCQLSPKTIYEWIGKGRLDGCFRKRGKHVLIWRDRALASIFNGKEWKNG